MATTDVVKTIRMSPAANRAVKAAASAAGISDAEFIRRALDQATWAERVAQAQQAAEALAPDDPDGEREAAWRRG